MAIQNKASKYEVWARDGFVGLTREELVEAGEAFGCHFAANQSVETMRKKLNEQFGTGVVPEPEPEKDKPLPESTRVMNPGRPKLFPSDNPWEGRRHTVTIAPTREEDLSRPSFILWWSGVPMLFEFNRKINMPEPYYFNARDAVVRDTKQNKVFRTDNPNELDHMETEDVVRKRYAITYHGVTPGTQDLPGSLTEYWQARARKNDYFGPLVKHPNGRRILVQIYSDIVEPRSQEFFKDLTNEDLHVEIMHRLGFEDKIYNGMEEALIL